MNFKNFMFLYILYYLYNCCNNVQQVHSYFYKHIYLKQKKVNKLLKKNLLYKTLNFKLDIYLLKIGFCKTISQARQLINHKKVLVNDFVIQNPNFTLKKNDTISLLINQSLKYYVYYNIKLYKHFFHKKENNFVLNFNNIININKFNCTIFNV